MEARPRLLVVDDDPTSTEDVRTAFAADGFDVRHVASLTEATTLVRQEPPRVLLTALDLPDGKAFDLLNRPELSDAGCVSLVTAHEVAVQDVVEAMRHGAVDVIEKPLFAGHLLAVVRKTLADRRAREREAPQPIEPVDRPRIVGSSEALEALVEPLRLVTQAPKATVLIQGESGTGKELIARAIHYDGPREGGPFLAVNCATLTENLLEAELFGYEKGAFTGALGTGKKGLFDAAAEGTLFLDEVGELASALQAKLLRVLQEGAFKRVGGVRDVKVDVRIIAATNRDLRKEVADGRFRADLFYRLNVVPLRVPHLRERREDIRELAEHFLGELASDLGKDISGLSPAAMTKLERYDWPGNIRELRNVCEYAAIVCETDLIEPRHLTLPDVAERPVSDHEVLPLTDRSLRGMESELIRMVLNETRFNITRAANILGINRSTLYNKMRDYGLQRGERSKIRQPV